MKDIDQKKIINENEGKTIILLMDSKRDNSKYFAKLFDGMLF